MTMRRFAFTFLTVGILGLTVSESTQVQPQVVSNDAAEAAARDSASPAQRCTGCHSERGKAGGLVPGRVSTSRRRRRAWRRPEKIIRKLRAGMMPPPRREASGRRGSCRAGAKGPRRRASTPPRLVNPNPGLASVPASQPRRVRPRHQSDLLGIDVDVNAFLPPDTISRRLRQRRGRRRRSRRR